ncbi:MAG: hypothetical protein KJN92_12255, partial [Gemmatimonadetes bacterium]|nr:hypothetical protein [Gemmatimonadota bacterium]
MEALVVLAFVVVILVVPVLLAPPPSDRDAEPPVLDHGGTAPSSFFGSRRERRLWMWTLIVLVGIFSSLGPARDLASALRERNLLGVSSAAVVLL